MSAYENLNYSLHETTLEQVVDQAILNTVGHINNRHAIGRAITDAIVDAQLDGEHLAARGKIDMLDPEALIRYLEFSSSELERVKAHHQKERAALRQECDALNAEIKELKERL